MASAHTGKQQKMVPSQPSNMCRTSLCPPVMCLKVGGCWIGEVLSSCSLHKDLHPCCISPGTQTHCSRTSTFSLQCFCKDFFFASYFPQVCIIHLHYFHEPFLQLTDLKTVVETHNSTITRSIRSKIPQLLPSPLQVFPPHLIIPRSPHYPVTSRSLTAPSDH